MTFNDFCNFVNINTEIEVTVFGKNKLPYVIRPTQYDTNDPQCLVHYFKADGEDRMKVVISKDISKELRLSF